MKLNQLCVLFKHLIYLMVNYLKRKYGVSLHNFFENWTRGISHLKWTCMIWHFLCQEANQKNRGMFETKKNSNLEPKYYICQEFCLFLCCQLDVEFSICIRAFVITISQILFFLSFSTYDRMFQKKWSINCDHDSPVFKWQQQTFFHEFYTWCASPK